jgi:hypothetical protein
MRLLCVVVVLIFCAMLLILIGVQHHQRERARAFAESVRRESRVIGIMHTATGAVLMTGRDPIHLFSVDPGRTDEEERSLSVHAEIGQTNSVSLPPHIPVE